MCKVVNPRESISATLAARLPMISSDQSVDRALKRGLTHLDALEAESVFIMREVAAEFERPSCSSPAARTRSCCCASPRRRSARRASRSRSCTSTRATTSRRSSSSATGAWRSSGSTSSSPRCRSRSTRAASARSRATRRATASRPRRCSTRSRSTSSTRLRRRAARRGEGARQGARLLAARRVRAVGAQGPAARALEPLQRAPQPRPAHARLPHLQLDRDGRLAVHRAREARGALDLLRPRARRLPPRRHVALDQPVPAPRPRRDGRADGRSATAPSAT